MSDTLAPPLPTALPAPLTELRTLAASYNTTARPGRRAHLAHLRAVYARGAATAPSAATAHLYGVTRAHAYLALLASCSTPVNPLTPDRDLLPPHHPLSLRAPEAAAPTTAARPITAAIIIDSLGRPWRSFLHPRDRYGRFIPTLGNLQLFKRGSSGVSDKHYATGRYVGANPDGSVQVRLNAIDDPNQQGQIGETITVPADQVATVSSHGRDQKADISGRPTDAAQDTIEYRNAVTQDAFTEGVEKLGDVSTPAVNVDGVPYQEGDRITTQVHSEDGGQDEIASRNGTIEKISTTKDGKPNALIQFDGEPDQENPDGVPEYAILDLSSPDIAKATGDARRPDIKATLPTITEERAEANPQRPAAPDIADIQQRGTTVGENRPAAARLEGYEEVGERETLANRNGEQFSVGSVVRVGKGTSGTTAANNGQLAVVGNIKPSTMKHVRVYFRDPETGRWEQTNTFFSVNSVSLVDPGDVDYLTFLEGEEDPRGRGLQPGFKRIAPLQPKGSTSRTDHRQVNGADGLPIQKNDHVAGVRSKDGTVVQGTVQNISPSGDNVQVVPYGGGDKISISPKNLRWVRNASSAYTAGDREDVFIGPQSDKGAASPDRESLKDVLVASGFSDETINAIDAADPAEFGDILRADPAYDELARRQAATKVLDRNDPARHSSEARADRMYGEVVRAGEAGRISGETLPRKPADNQVSRESARDEIQHYFPPYFDQGDNEAGLPTPPPPDTSPAPEDTPTPAPTPPPSPEPEAGPTPEPTPEAAPTPDTSGDGEDAGLPTPPPPTAPEPGAEPVPPTATAPAPPRAAQPAQTPIARAAGAYGDLANRLKQHPNSRVQKFADSIQDLSEQLGEIDQLDKAGDREGALRALAHLGTTAQSIRKINKPLFQQLVGPGAKPADRALFTNGIIPALSNIDRIVAGGDRVLTPDNNPKMFRPDAPTTEKATLPGLPGVPEPEAAVVPTGSLTDQVLGFPDLSAATPDQASAAFDGLINAVGDLPGVSDVNKTKMTGALTRARRAVEKAYDADRPDEQRENLLNAAADRLSAVGREVGGDHGDALSGFAGRLEHMAGDLPEAGLPTPPRPAERPAPRAIPRPTRPAPRATPAPTPAAPAAPEPAPAPAPAPTPSAPAAPTPGPVDSTDGPGDPTGWDWGANDPERPGGGPTVSPREPDPEPEIPELPEPPAPAPEPTPPAPDEPPVIEITPPVPDGKWDFGDDDPELNPALPEPPPEPEPEPQPDLFADSSTLPDPRPGAEDTPLGAMRDLFAQANENAAHPESIGRVGLAASAVQSMRNSGRLSGSFNQWLRGMGPDSDPGTGADGKALTARLLDAQRDDPNMNTIGALGKVVKDFEKEWLDKHADELNPKPPEPVASSRDKAVEIANAVNADPSTTGIEDPDDARDELRRQATPAMNDLFEQVGGDLNRMREDLRWAFQSSGIDRPNNAANMVIRMWAAQRGIQQMTDAKLPLHHDQSSREAIGRVWSGLVDPASDVSFIRSGLIMFADGDDQMSRDMIADSATAMSQLLTKKANGTAASRAATIDYYDKLAATARSGGDTSAVEKPLINAPDDPRYKRKDLGPSDGKGYVSDGNISVMFPTGSGYQMTMLATQEDMLAGKTQYGYPLISYGANMYAPIETVKGPTAAKQRYIQHIAASPDFTSFEQERLRDGVDYSRLRDRRKFAPGTANWAEVDVNEYNTAKRDIAMDTMVDRLNKVLKTPTTRAALEITLKGTDPLAKDKHQLPAVRVFRNGNVNVELGADTLRVWGNDFDKNMALIQGQIDMLMDTRGVHDKPVTVRVSNDAFDMHDRLTGENSSNTVAWAILSDHSIQMKAALSMNTRVALSTMTLRNPKVNDPDGGGDHWMQANGGKIMGLTALSHEWGHMTDIADREMSGVLIGDQNAVDSGTLDTPNVVHIPATSIVRDTGEVEWFDNNKLFDLAKLSDPTLSLYSKESPYELRAELFGEWVESYGQTNSPMSRFYNGTDADRKEMASIWFQQTSTRQALGSGALSRYQELVSTGMSNEDAAWQAFREKYGFYNRSVRSHGSAYVTIAGYTGDQQFYDRMYGVNAALAIADANRLRDLAAQAAGAAPAAPEAPAPAEGVAP